MVDVDVVGLLVLENLVHVAMVMILAPLTAEHSCAGQA